MKKIIILYLLVFVSCSSVMSSKTGVGIKAGGYEEKDQIGADFTFYGKSPEEQIKKAKHLSSLGKFEEAVAVLGAVIKDHKETIFSDQAYLEMGKLYSNILNMKKDFEKAKQYYQGVLHYPPESEYDEMARKALKNLEALLENERKN